MIIDGEQQALENLMKLIEDNCKVRDGAQQNIEAAIAKLMVESQNRGIERKPLSEFDLLHRTQ